MAMVKQMLKSQSFKQCRLCCFVFLSSATVFAVPFLGNCLAIVSSQMLVIVEHKDSLHTRGPAEQKHKGSPFYGYCSYVKGSALAVTIMFLPATSGVLPFPDFAEASEEVLYHQRSFPLRLVEPAQVLPVCLSRTQLPFFQRSVCGHRR